MKNTFIVFARDTYYPAPGWKSYKKNFFLEIDAIEYAKKITRNNKFYWWQVVDLNEMKIVSINISIKSVDNPDITKRQMLIIC